MIFVVLSYIKWIKTDCVGFSWPTNTFYFLWQLMLEKDPIMEIPTKQKMERQQTLAKEHGEEYAAALQRAVKLAVPHAVLPSQYGTFQDSEDGEGSSGESFRKHTPGRSWDELIESLFDKDESGYMVLKKSHSVVWLCKYLLLEIRWCIYYNCFFGVKKRDVSNMRVLKYSLRWEMFSWCKTEVVIVIISS